MNKAFDRVAGYEEEKKELSNLAKILKDRDKLIEAGGELPKGILITGELGQGKTTIVEAFIKESGLPSVLITPNNIQVRIKRPDFTPFIFDKYVLRIARTLKVGDNDAVASEFIGQDSSFFNFAAFSVHNQNLAVHNQDNFVFAIAVNIINLCR